MACSSPRKRAVSNLLALVDQSEGLKTKVRERRWRVKKEEKEQLEGEKRNGENRQSEEKRRKGETSSEGEVPHLERNSTFLIKHQQQARWGDTAPIRLLSLHSGGVCRSCYFLL